MIYTELTRKAARIAAKAHVGQEDKSGWPYILHPVHLAEQMTTEDTCVVALLHDVVEDTGVTLEDLAKEGFTEEQLEAVRVMTHAKEVPYLDYVREIAKDPIARVVKRADLKHNLDLHRMLPSRESYTQGFSEDAEESLCDTMRKKRELYRKALIILDDQDL